MRHVEALETEFDVVTVGAGPSPTGVVRHHEIPPVANPRRGLWLTTRLLQAARLTAAARRLLPQERATGRILSGEDFDGVLCNDADTIPVAFAAAGARPVVVDMHEYAPRHFENSIAWRIVKRPMDGDCCTDR